MKWILIFIIFGMLLGLASATITVSGNCTRPHFEVELIVSDGTAELEVGSNYYLQCFMGGYGYGGESMGPASEEFNITVNSTHRWINLSGIQDMCGSYVYSTLKGVHCRYSINQSFLDWGGEGYMPWAFDSNNSGTGHTKWMAQYANPGGYFAPALRCSQGLNYQNITTTELKDGTAYASRYVHHPEIAVPLAYRDNLDNSYNVSCGGIYILYNESHTFIDLGAALYDSGFAGSFDASDNIISILGEINFAGQTVTFSKKVLNKIMYTDDGMANVYFEDFANYILSSNYPYLTSTSWWGNYDSSSLISEGTVRDTLDNVNAVNTNICLRNPSHGTNNTGFNYYCGLHSTIYFVDNEHNWNSNYYGAEDYVLPTGTTGHYTSYWENITFYNEGKVSYDLRAYPGYIDGCHNTTRDQDMKNVKSDRPGGRPIVYYIQDVTEAQWCLTSYNFTFHGDIIFTILDENGVSIQNANVTLISDYFTYTGLTNANGVIIHDARFYNVWLNASAVGAPNQDVTDEQGSYNLTITATNYESYSTNVTFNEEQKWTIALESRDWNYSKVLDHSIINSTGTTLMKLSEEGNLAIAGKLYEDTNTAPNNILYSVKDLFWLTRTGDLYILGELMEMIT